MEIWESGFQGIEAKSGKYFLELDARKGDHADAISQTVKTVPGNTYFLRFDLRQRRNTPEEVIVEWNDEKTYPLGNPKTTTKGEWEQQTFVFTSTTDQATIKLTTLNNTGGDVLIGLVPVTGSQGAGFTVDGKDPRDGRLFDKAVRDSLINPEDGASQTKGKTITERWSMNSSDAGLYAPVLITEDDQVMTFGRRFGSTSDQRLKVLGENVVGFELSAKNNGSNQEWHYDDVIVEASLG